MTEANNDISEDVPLLVTSTEKVHITEPQNKESDPPAKTFDCCCCCCLKEYNKMLEYGKARYIGYFLCFFCCFVLNHTHTHTHTHRDRFMVC